MFKGRSVLWVAFAGLMLALVSCSCHYRIDGVVQTSGYEGRQLLLVEFLPFRTTTIDSCVVSRGRFEMKGVVDSVRLVFICNEGHPVVPVYIEKGHTKVEILPTKMTASGTRQNDLFYSFLRKKIEIDNRYDDMLQKRISLSRSVYDAAQMDLIQDSLSIIVDECEQMICSFMADNYNEPAAVGVFTMLSPPRAKEITPLIKRILDAAPESFLAQSYVSGYIRRVGYSRD